MATKAAIRYRDSAIANTRRTYQLFAKGGAHTVTQASKRSGVSRSIIKGAMGLMHRDKVLRIAGWSFGIGGTIMPIYVMGVGDDAPPLHFVATAQMILGKRGAILYARENHQHLVGEDDKDEITNKVRRPKTDLEFALHTWFYKFMFAQVPKRNDKQLHDYKFGFLYHNAPELI